MGTKIIVLFVVSVLALEINGATNPEICSLPLVTGFCRAGGTQWGYDPLAKKCVTFPWGGCNDGNENRFNTRELCEKTCQTDEQETTITPRNEDFVVIPGKCSCQCPKCDLTIRANSRSQSGTRNLIDLPMIFPNY